MADIAISYSHRDMDFVRAVEQRARAAGHSVWLDDPSDRDAYGAGMTMPSGQNHWDVISREFLNATAVVVLRTPNWEGSEYCRREQLLLTEWGKWTAYVTPGDVSGFERLLADFDRYAQLAEAQARLIDAARQGGHGRTSIVERLLARSEAADAQLVIDEAATAPWPLLTPVLDPYLREVLARRSAGRRRLRQTALTSVSILSILALLSVVAWVVAVFAQRTAQENADRSRAMALIAQSETEPDTMRAVALAKEAVTLNPGRASSDSLAVAQDRDRRLRTGSVRRGNAYALVLAPTGTAAASVGVDEIHVFDRDTGDPVATIDDSVGPVFGSLLFTPDGSKIVYIDKRLQLVKRPVAGGPPTTLASSVRSLASDGHRLWWSSGSQLVSAGFDGEDRKSTSVERALSALSIDPGQGLADGIDTSGRLVTFRLAGGQATLRSARAIGGGDKQYSSGSRLNPVVVRCGERAFGVLPNYKMKLRATHFVADSDRIELVRGSSGFGPPVCLSDDDALATSIHNSVRTFRGSPIPRFRSVTTAEERQSRLAVARAPDGRVYVVSPEGKLYSFEPSFAATIAAPPEEVTNAVDSRGEAPSETAATSAEVIALGQVEGGVIGFSSAGKVLDLNDGSVIFPGWGEIYPGMLAVNSSGTAITTGRGQLIVGADRKVYTVPHTGDPMNQVGLTSSGDEKSFVAAYVDHADVIGKTGQLERTVRFSWIDEDDGIVAAALAPDGKHVAVATHSGRVALVKDGENPIFLETPLAVGLSKQIAVTKTGDVLVTTPDGRILRLRHEGDELRVKGAVLYGAPAVNLSVSGDRVLVAGRYTDSAVYRADDLGAVARVSSSLARQYSVQLSNSSRQMIGIDPGGRVVRVPLPD